MAAKPKLAGSLVNLRAEIDLRWPKRDRRTDGWIGDAAHQARESDHNPDSRGIVHAIDIDKDGIVPNVVVEHCIRDDRPTSYVIWNRQIWSRSKDWKPRKYTGSNPHTDHIHVSCMYGAHWESTEWHWGVATADTPEPGVVDLTGVEDMSDWRVAFEYVQSPFNTTGGSFIQAAAAIGQLLR